MWLRNILAYLQRRSVTAESRDPGLEIAVKAPVINGFREFTPPANVQIGGRLRSGARHSDRRGRIGIIPSMGVKVP